MLIKRHSHATNFGSWNWHSTDANFDQLHHITVQHYECIVLHVWVYGWRVKLCDPPVTHGPYLSALETGHNKALYKFTFVFDIQCQQPSETSIHLLPPAASCQRETGHNKALYRFTFFFTYNASSLQKHRLISYLQQPRVKGGQVSGDIVQPGGVQSPRDLLRSSDVGWKSNWIASAFPSIQDTCRNNVRCRDFIVGEVEAVADRRQHLWVWAKLTTPIILSLCVCKHSAIVTGKHLERIDGSIICCNVKSSSIKDRAVKFACSVGFWRLRIEWCGRYLFHVIACDHA